MKVLLLAMPTFSRYFRSHGYPNLGVCSLAAHVENADVKICELRFVEDPVRTVKDLMHHYDPDVVGFSAMSFQYKDALKFADLVKSCKPTVKTVLGGYHATSAYAYVGQSWEGRLFDFNMRGESEQSFNQLVQALACGDKGYDRIPGLGWWDGDAMRQNELPENLDVDRIKLPARHKRIHNEFYGWGERVDLIETSRGCTLPCSYCSITRMYGRSFREYELDRVIEDVLVLKSMGVQKILIVDDNITLNVKRFKEFCRRLLAERIEMKWHVQATVAGIASDEELVELMGRVGFLQVFLGIERLDRETLKYFKKGGGMNTTARAVSYLQKNGIRVLGGFIIGSPDDSRETISELAHQIRVMDIDLPYLQILTPYPNTDQRRELVEMGLVTNPDDFTKYNGDHANVRTHHLSPDDLRRAQHLAHARIYLDPRTRAGKHFYKGLLAPHVPLTLVSWLKDIWLQRSGKGLGYGQEERYPWLESQGFQRPAPPPPSTTSGQAQVA